MKKDVIVLNCKECGKDFLYEYSGKGAKPLYCEDCKAKVILKSKQAYRDKQKQKNTQDQTESVDENVDFIKRLSDLLMKLDTTRVELCQLATDIKEYQSAYDKNDQIYLHKLETIDENNVKEAQMLVKNWKNSRNGRRNVKDLLGIINNTVSAIPYKSYANACPILKGSAYTKRG